MPLNPGKDRRQGRERQRYDGQEVAAGGGTGAKQDGPASPSLHYPWVNLLPSHAPGFTGRPPCFEPRFDRRGRCTLILEVVVRVPSRYVHVRVRLSCRATWSAEMAENLGITGPVSVLT